MTRQDIVQILEKGPLLLDGATGSNLQKQGMPINVCPELWIHEHPQVIMDLQRSYVDAGSKVLLAPTFTANRVKLAEYGLEDRLEELNRSMVAKTREAAGDRAYVAGDLTMTGRQLYPTGDMMFEELVDVYKEQVRAILKEGVDLFVVETMMSLQECRAALLAIKETCELPVMVSLTYQEDGRTLYGTLPETAMIVLQSMGADAVGINCSTGPKDMIPLVQAMAKYANIPILVKPNAGMPELVDGATVYPMKPEAFKDAVLELVQAGASIIGGCCGTTPEHIAALAKAMDGVRIPKREPVSVSVVTSERKQVSIDKDGGFLVVGERINPTGKKALQEELRAGSLDMVCRMAREQEEAGASILDINMGTNGIAEREMMVEAIYEVTSTVDCPLCIDTSFPEVMEAALRIYPGRALINSISLEREKMELLLPIAAKYGAMFVLLPLSSAGLPGSLEEKHDNIHRILEEIQRFDIPREAAVVDILVTTVGANPQAALECLSTITYCRQTLGLPTICGLSNISFGMPQRAIVNTAFLNLALGRGLTMAIANPCQEMFMYTALAADMLLQKPKAVQRYLDTVPSVSLQTSVQKREDRREQGAEEPVTDRVCACVVKGDKGSIISEIDLCLKQGETPEKIIENHLIPGINQVGEYYDRKKYFLPQLIGGANAMKVGMEYLEPMLEADRSEEKNATVVVATVEGDIHDIGKNLVVLMLKNYGFRVIDLGKDVPAQRIVETAMEENAQVIGLSALMTTTMMKMKDVVELAGKRGCKAKIIIGGAAITSGFADEIGADGYSSDAADCVKLVKSLTEL